MHKNSAMETAGKRQDGGAGKDRAERKPLDGRTWLRYSISVWDDLAKNTAERSLKHPAMFPAALTDRLIEIFCPPRGVVLDPFMGSGSTVCSAFAAGHKSIGFELSAEYVGLAERRLAETGGDPGDYPRIIRDDSRRLGRYLAPETVHFCVTSPPYWDILRQRRSADGKAIRHYGDHDRDLGRIPDYRAFLDEVGIVFEQVYRVLAVGSYCVVVVMDLRKRSDFFPYHMDITRLLTGIGFVLDDIIIWDRRQEYNNLRPLGYPYVFRVNKVHEFILIFQKRDTNR